MKTQTLTDNDPLGRKAGELASTFETLLAAKMMEVKNEIGGHPAHQLYLGIMALANAAQLVSKILTMPLVDDTDDPEAQEWFNSAPSRTAMLVVGTLMARCGKPVVNPDGSKALDFEFGPRHIRAAIEAAEKVLGRAIRQEFPEAMIKAAWDHPSAAHLFDNSPSAPVMAFQGPRSLH